MSAAAVVVIPIRRAQARDVKNANLSRWAAIVYKDLVTHANAENLCWPKRETQAKDLHISTRTITNARNELLEKGWICYPEGDTGGRDFSKENWTEPRGRGLRIHLHPDGCPCGLPKVGLKQHAAAAAANEKRAQKRAAREAVKDEIGDSAYKERTLPSRTFSTATATRTREAEPVAAAEPSQKKTENPSNQFREPEIVKEFAQLQALLKDNLAIFAQRIEKVKLASRRFPLGPQTMELSRLANSNGAGPSNWHLLSWFSLTLSFY